MKILLAILLLAVPALGQAPVGPPQGPPPKNLTKQPDGHVSANTDPANSDKYETHVVLAGETLSQISAQVLKDSRLWPQLWEMNEHIVNPHWIYPNDKILVRPVTKITEATPPPPTEPAAAAAPAAAATPAPAPAAPVAVVAAPPAPQAPPPVPASVGIAVLSRMMGPASVPASRPVDVFDLSEAPLVPALKSSDVYCSGFIRDSEVPDKLRVTSTYLKDKSQFSTQGEYIRLNQGSSDGVMSGARYQVLRATRKVSDPSKGIAGSGLGRHYMDVAQAQVVQVLENSSLAEIIYSCDAVEPTDVLVPYVRHEVPQAAAQSAVLVGHEGNREHQGRRCIHAQCGCGSGFRIQLFDGAFCKITCRRRGVVYLNVGITDGVKPGDLFIVYHGTAAIAEVAVLKVEEHSSSALVTYSTEPLLLGDPIERR